jgi:hypothetical protein
MARPEKPVDWKKVEHLLMAGCKGTEIAPHFDMNVETFYRKVEETYKVGFTEYSRIKKDQGDSLLRAKQFEKALEKDNTMLIWLGKQRLDQKEPDSRQTHSEINLKEQLAALESFSQRYRQGQLSEDKASEANHNDSQKP